MWVQSFKDIYYLDNYVDEWKKCNSFGEKSVEKIIDSIEHSRNVSCANFITALSIDGIGKSAAKIIAEHFNNDFYAIITAYNNGFNWTQLDGFGDISAQNINDFFDNNLIDVLSLSREMRFIKPVKIEQKKNPFNNKTLCVTGKLNHFTRDSINEKIISLGAKSAGSVSSKTNYLITNEASGSSKYKKAQELGIPIITEAEFLAMIGEVNEN
jgi:DNA ligase (NAD+)